MRTAIAFTALFNLLFGNLFSLWQLEHQHSHDHSAQQYVSYEQATLTATEPGTGDLIDATVDFSHCHAVFGDCGHSITLESHIRGEHPASPTVEQDGHPTLYSYTSISNLDKPPRTSTALI